MKLPSMRSLIIPDLHHQTENADYWLNSQRYDRVIFLGDYFDNFGDKVPLVPRLHRGTPMSPQFHCAGERFATPRRKGMAQTSA